MLFRRLFTESLMVTAPLFAVWWFLQVPGTSRFRCLLRVATPS